MTKKIFKVDGKTIGTNSNTMWTRYIAVAFWADLEALCPMHEVERIMIVGDLHE